MCLSLLGGCYRIFFCFCFLFGFFTKWPKVLVTGESSGEVGYLHWGFGFLELMWPPVKSRLSSEVPRSAVASSRAPGAVLPMGVNCVWAYGVCWSSRKGLFIC